MRQFDKIDYMHNNPWAAVWWRTQRLALVELEILLP